MGNKYFWPQSELDFLEQVRTKKVSFQSALDYVDAQVEDRGIREFVRLALEAVIFQLTAETWKVDEDDGRKAMDALLIADILRKG